MSRRVVVATGNAHKLVEIRAILAEMDGLADLELVAMTELGVPSPVEDGETFEDNALLKARACAEATGSPALADDSGLEVDALGGEPGVRSARYAGEPADDAANNAKLLAALRDVAPPERTGRFVAAAALVTPDGAEVVVRGTMPGRIVDAPRGEHGFGYDPLFVAEVTADGRTNGELTPTEKDAISHRGAAFRELAPHVAARLSR
ncbi:RdgB/HAM1 family non-canonical purine NTP pyrophosphatase [Nitriliruptoraceae bacterium ZYF776]|nr:RdgB/HAM1 family non-canonical purine NTP pyrophosphatase [Profundirhabdus halotolerans]